MTSPAATAQTLEELERPLLAPGQATVSIDHNEFAFERTVVELGYQPATFFEPSYHALYPAVGLGLSKRVQVTVDGTYLFPTDRRYRISSDPGSRLESRWLLKSLGTEVKVRPSDRVEIDATYLLGRTRYDSSFPDGNGTSVHEAADTHLLQVQGLWLPRPDRESRPRGADLDGLSGPLLGTHRARVDWQGTWRRYGSTQTNQDAAGSYSFEETHSTDVRLRLGAGYGLRGRLELSGDGYWQPAFTVGDSRFYQPNSAPARLDERPRRLFGVWGARMKARWRPIDRFEAFGETTWEHQAVTFGPEPAAPSTNMYRQRRLTTGATWLSRSPHVRTVLRSDLNGLYRPLLERHQVRLDAILHLRRHDGDDSFDHLEKTVWRVQGSAGLWSFLEAGVYAGRFRTGPTFGSGLFSEGTSFGWTVTLRPVRRLEGYASFNYHPRGRIDAYPAFNLPRGSFFQSFYDFTNTAQEDDASLHFGLRLAF